MLMTEQIEQYMRTLKLGGLAKEWRSISYCDDPEQYVKELLELREREANRINRMVKTAASLANLLLERNNKGTINAFLGTLRKAELLVIDEIGFVPLHKDAAELLFQVISDCYERKSLIITSNLEFS